MSKKLSLESAKIESDVITTEAASWLAQIDGGELSPSDKLALSEWVSRSPRHESEIRKLDSAWSDVDDLLDMALLAQSPPSIWATFKSWLQIKPVSAYGALAIVSLAMISVVLFSSTKMATVISSGDGQFVTYQVERGQHKVIALKDGSTMHLNSNSVAEVVYFSNERRVWLRKGEGIFNVIDDPSKPFRVYGGGGRVEALGTKFLLKLNGDNLRLTVTEGKVRMDQLAHKMVDIEDGVVNFSPQQQATLERGYRVNSEAIGDVQKIDQAAVERSLAWTKGKHIFLGDTLGYVVDEFNRHSEKQLIIQDPGLFGIEMGGVFGMGETEAFLSALQASFALKIEYTEDNRVLISRAQPEAREP